MYQFQNLIEHFPRVEIKTHWIIYSFGKHYRHRISSNLLYDMRRMRPLEEVSELHRNDICVYAPCTIWHFQNSVLGFSKLFLSIKNSLEIHWWDINGGVDDARMSVDIMHAVAWIQVQFCICCKRNWCAMKTVQYGDDAMFSKAVTKPTTLPLMCVCKKVKYPKKIPMACSSGIAADVAQNAIAYTHTYSRCWFYWLVFVTFRYTGIFCECAKVLNA